MTIRLSKKAKQRRRMLKELDEHARQAVFERDNRCCVRCGDSRVQWAHVFTRVHLCLRWEAENALSLCGGCHIWWHKYPLLSVEWFRKNWPERYAAIMDLYQVNPKVNVADKLEELRNQ